MEITTIDSIKKSFRVAYQFMETHRTIVKERGDIEQIAFDLGQAIAENKDDPLTCRLLSGVYDFICAESRRLGK